MNQQQYGFSGLPAIELAGFGGVGTMPSPQFRPAAGSGMSADLGRLGMNTGSGLRTAVGNMPPVGAVAGADAGGGWFSKIGGLEGIASLAQGLASLGQVYGALQSVKLGKEQLNLSREAYQTNLANQRQSYNTALEDRIRSRHVMEGRGSGETDAYLAKNKL